MPSTAKISVIMPVGKLDHHLDTTLDSLEAQTFRDFELIAVCDQSDYEQLRAVVNHPRLNFAKMVIPTRLGGFAFALNLGIAQSTAEFIARWDADDLCDSNRFERQLQEFGAAPHLGVVGTRVTLIDADGAPIRYRRFPYYGDDAQIRWALKYRQALLHSSLMFRARILYENNGYEYGHTSEDHELFLRIARNKTIKFKNLPDVVSYYRLHPDQRISSAIQYHQFCDITGFMVTEFLRTGHPLHIVGFLAVVPLAREFRRIMRRARARFLP